jgi:hypothetical protein
MNRTGKKAQAVIISRKENAERRSHRGLCSYL